MDGIEATKFIRAWEEEHGNNSASFTEGETRSNNRILRKQIPIIALTANAVVGMREMFLENGFNDFISKPIDVSKLDEILKRWIETGKRDEEKEKKDEEIEQAAISNEQLALRSLYLIPGVDTAKGIAMTGGSLDSYKKILDIFCKDIEERLQILQNTPEADTLSSFIINFHALKAASGSLGAKDVSTQAAELEAAGKSEDMAYVREHLPVFVQRLRELKENIRDALKQNEAAAPDLESNIAHSSLLIANSSPPDSSSLSEHFPLFNELTEALKSRNAAKIENILEELNKKPLDAKVKEALEEVSDEVLITEFDNALKIINGITGAQTN